MKIFVRTHTFLGDNYPLFWSSNQHAWGCLSNADVYTTDEVQSFTKYNDDRGGRIIHHKSNVPIYVPVEGEWEELPRMCKLKTLEEYLSDEE